jgi:lipoate-protein ligase A
VTFSGEAVKRAVKGVIRAKVVVDTRARKILEVQLTGDFFAYPEEAVWRLEEALRGAPIGQVPVRVAAALEGVKLVGCTPSDFVEAVLEAVERAGAGAEAIGKASERDRA